MTKNQPKIASKELKKHAALVTLLCYLPFFLTNDWWVFFLVLGAVSYRLLSDYFSLHNLSIWIRLLLVILCFILLKIQYTSMISSGFFIGFLLAFVALKLLEIHNTRDIKILIFCNFYLIFSALLITQELWIISYLFIAILTNLTLMLKLHAPSVSLAELGGKSTKQLLIALPLGILVFYIFPRIADPLWNVPTLSQSHTGFSDKMTPGSIAELFADTSTALRVTFTNKPIMNGYWRGLTLSVFNGETWGPDFVNDAWSALIKITPDKKPDYDIIVEPHQKKWLFYIGFPVASRPDLMFSSANGLIRLNGELINQRFSYALITTNTPYRALTITEKEKNTRLPKASNPQLTQWAKQQFIAVKQDVPGFITFLKDYLAQQPFWYTLTPPHLSKKHSMDDFWFNTHKGYCEHYASAVTIILRAAGIPAHVIVGYQGGRWNPVAQYLDIGQNDAHAWIEYWQQDYGWQLFDPTSFIAPNRIDQTILDNKTTLWNQDNYADTTKLSWLVHTQLLINSMRFFAERWLLFYNQDTQHNLLQLMGLGDWGMAQLLRAVIFAFIVFMLIISGYYRWQQTESKNPLLKEYHLLQKEFLRFGATTLSSATLKQQCHYLANRLPALASTLALFLNRYERLRLNQADSAYEANQKETALLFKQLRLLLKRYATKRSK